MPPSPSRPQRHQEARIDWFTVSYKTIYAVAGIIVLIAAAAGYYFFVRPTAPPVATPPVETATRTTARFTSLGGSVKVKAVGSLDWRDATDVTELHRGDLVRTARDSSAEITFFDGSIVAVRPESLITIEESSENPQTKEPKIKWHISSGMVDLETRTATEVTTPTLRVRQEPDTSGAISVADSGESDVRIFRGAGDVETKAGQRVTLGSNEGLKVSAAGEAGAKQALPPVPRLVTPSHEAELIYPNPPMATTTLAWRGVDNAASYRVLVDTNPQFYRPLVDQLNRATAVQLRGLETGRYYWKVAAVSASHVEGSFSEFHRFTVARQAPGVVVPPPPLTLEAFDLRANILQLKGQTEPGASVLVNEQRLDVHPDGSFNEYITLGGLGKQQVKIRVVGLDGGIREETRSVVVAF